MHFKKVLSQNSILSQTKIHSESKKIFKSLYNKIEVKKFFWLPNKYNQYEQIAHYKTKSDQFELVAYRLTQALLEMLTHLKII